jgi:4'-phosphopantetheinyl transferase
LTRSVLAGYCAVEPLELRFAKSPAGKPELASPEGSGLQFSLAHTKGMAALLVGRDRALGVDVEASDRYHPSKVPTRLLGSAEAAALQLLPPERRPVRFLEHWTLKEAYAKARGGGLSLPLEGWEFEIDGGEVRARLDPNLEPEPERWWFTLGASTPEFVTAVAAALHSAGEAPPQVRVFE